MKHQNTSLNMKFSYCDAEVIIKDCGSYTATETRCRGSEVTGQDQEMFKEQRSRLLCSRQVNLF